MFQANGTNTFHLPPLKTLQAQYQACDPHPLVQYHWQTITCSISNSDSSDSHERLRRISSHTKFWGSDSSRRSESTSMSTSKRSRPASSMSCSGGREPCQNTSNTFFTLDLSSACPRSKRRLKNCTSSDASPSLAQKNFPSSLDPTHSHPKPGRVQHSRDHGRHGLPSAAAQKHRTHEVPAARDFLRSAEEPGKTKQVH